MESTLAPPAPKQYVFDDFTAVGVAEGFHPVESREHQLAAWQYLVDTGLAWELHGHIGRQAKFYIQEGFIKEGPKKKNN